MAKLSLGQLDLGGKRVFLRADFNVAAGRAGGATTRGSPLPSPPSGTASTRAPRCVLASHLGRPKGKPDPDSRWPGGRPPRRAARPPGTAGPGLRGPGGGGDGRRSGRARCCCSRICASIPRRKPTTTASRAGSPRWPTLRERRLRRRAPGARLDRGHHALPQPAVAGLLMSRELEALAGSSSRPSGPHGGAGRGQGLRQADPGRAPARSASTALLIGGGMAFTFLAPSATASAAPFSSPTAEAARAVWTRARARGVALRLPVDVVVAAGLESTRGHPHRPVREIPADLMGLDIGPATVSSSPPPSRARAPWCGTGPWASSSRRRSRRARRLASGGGGAAAAFTVIGGGDTVAAVQRRAWPTRSAIFRPPAAPSSSSSRAASCRASRR